MPDEPSSRAASAVQRVLTVLADPDCRRLFRELDEPTTARELMDRCDLAQTTTYRKLDRLSETDLVTTTTDVRDDGHHTTRYERTVEGVFVGLGDDDGFEVQFVADGESADETLARLWSEVRDGL